MRLNSISGVISIVCNALINAYSNTAMQTEEAGYAQDRKASDQDNSFKKKHIKIHKRKQTFENI